MFGPDFFLYYNFFEKVSMCTFCTFFDMLEQYDEVGIKVTHKFEIRT